MTLSIGPTPARRTGLCLALVGVLLIAAAADAQTLTFTKAFSGPTMPLNGTTTLTFTARDRRPGR